MKILKFQGFFIKKNKTHLSFVSFFLVMILVATTYSWFVYQRLISQNRFQPGSLDPNLEVLHWNKQSLSTNKWEKLEILAGGQSLPLLGEMRDITQLPDDSYAYIKIKVKDNSTARYNYNIILEDISLDITSIDEEIDITDAIEAVINYFDATPSQKCFDFFYAVDVDGKTPTELFPNPDNLAVSQIATRGQSLTGNEFIADTWWLYIMITPRLVEIQNLIMLIPVEYSPYQLCFIFHLKSEVRTLDNE